MILSVIVGVISGITSFFFFRGQDDMFLYILLVGIGTIVMTAIINNIICKSVDEITFDVIIITPIFFTLGMFIAVIIDLIF
jgi:hypothetical protein